MATSNTRAAAAVMRAGAILCVCGLIYIEQSMDKVLVFEL
jgi:hypothetical protein